IIILCSYEITLKVKGTGTKNILGSSSSYIYPCPSKIYLKNELVTTMQDCHHVDIIESDSEVKMEWNDIIINSTKNMFCDCSEIIEIDMTKFDTSLVTDMSSMFSSCNSLKSLKVANLVTTLVQTMENMFFECTDLTSINLESFTIPSTTSLYRMFYGCINLEYINIKNFEEKQNINLDEMFYNITPSAVICLSSCPPPTNFTLTDMTETQVTVSWDGYDWNNFIISFDLEGFSNPDNGNKINVTNKVYYTFTNLNSGTRYDVYLKTVCGSKSSYWIGPLLASIESYNLKIKGEYSIDTCSKVIYDDGDYSPNTKSLLTIYPETSGKLLSIKGSGRKEKSIPNLCIYDGIGTSSTKFGCYYGSFTIPLLLSSLGSLTILNTFYSFKEDRGFKLVVGCIYISQSIYGLIKSNKCQTISCDNDWKNIQLKYQYRGNCYSICPNGTSNVNFTCYYNSVLEKCEQYSIESGYKNLCIKCKNNYYPMFNDKSNRNNFINCYQNNSLEKYYLDNEDFFFKSCYESC
ncbi:MAG: BspA family leucine-rich repeat surface protein, partial [Clostridia bacterium]|nr:BspA family leucine-rich repeat surface protein [Clostridia bacterium]